MTGEPLHYEPTLDLRPLAKEKTMPENPSDPSNSAVKSGTKTTEFYLTLAFTAAGFLLASGVFDMKDAPEWVNVVVRILGAVVALGKALGYDLGRAKVKSTVAEGAAAIAVEKIRSEAAPAALELLKSAGVKDPTEPASK